MGTSWMLWDNVTIQPCDDRIILLVDDWIHCGDELSRV
jgi:hypothetical protein